MFSRWCRLAPLQFWREIFSPCFHISSWFTVIFWTGLMRLQLIACVIARRSVASGVKYFMRFSILSYLRRDQGFLNSFRFYTIFRYSKCKYHIFYVTVIISFLVHRRSLMHFCIFICASEFIQTNHQRPLFFFLFLYVGKSSWTPLSPWKRRGSVGLYRLKPHGGPPDAQLECPRPISYYCRRIINDPLNMLYFNLI